MSNGLKGVASYENLPFIAANLAIKHYMQCPIVILDGIQCGFTIMSGTIPSTLNGKSYCL